MSRVPPICLYVASRADDLHDPQGALVAVLRDNGVKIVWSPIGQRSYTDTAPLLMSAQGVLCFENASTYHSMEVSFALGDASWEGEGRPLRDRPLPVFAYSEGGEDRRNWIWCDNRVIKLSPDSTAAAGQIITALSV